MLKKAMFTVVALIFAAVLAAPAKADAQVFFRVGVGPVVFGAAPAPVVVAPVPVVPAPAVVAAPYVAPGYVYPSVVVGGRWYPRGYAYRGYAPRYRYGWRR